MEGVRIRRFVRRRRVAPRSVVEQRFKVAAAVYYSENENVRTLDAIHDDVIAHCEAARAGAKIFIAGAADVRETGEKRETASNLVNQAGGHIHAGALLGSIEPDIIEIGLGSRRDTMRHFIGSIRQSGGRDHVLLFQRKVPAWIPV